MEPVLVVVDDASESDSVLTVTEGDYESIEVVGDDE